MDEEKSEDTAERNDRDHKTAVNRRRKATTKPATSSAARSAET
jgi:hypothetical protein